jgi:hypothetical protein
MASDLASSGSTVGSGCLKSTTRSFDPALETKSLSSEGVAAAGLVAMVHRLFDEVGSGVMISRDLKMGVLVVVDDTPRISEDDFLKLPNDTSLLHQKNAKNMMVGRGR